MARTRFFLYILLVSAGSCSTQKKDVFTELKIAKTVPPVYLNEADTGFTQRQDTVLYAGKLFTGFRFSLYPNADTAFIQSYFNGVEEGFQKKWYNNRQPEETRFYINGKKEGVHEGRWENGKPKFYFTANDDEYSGEFKEWYVSGLIGKWFHYRNGMEEGSEKLWWDNGSVRANYVVRNGKKYGLIGMKLCTNPNDTLNKK